MTAAFLFFLPMGALSYSLDFGEAGNRAYPDRASRRLLHGVAKLFGVFLAVCGNLVAFVYHLEVGKAHLAFGEIPARQAHVWLGLMAVGGACVMAASGLYKFIAATRDSAKLFRWHGLLGPLVWVCGLLCICIAAYFEYLEGAGHYTPGQVAAIIVAVVVVLVATAVQSRLAPRDHLDDHEEDHKSGLLQ
jgi:hypothetical protein